jgi:hypothetical protein
MAEVHFVSSCVCEWYYKYKQEDTLLPLKIKYPHFLLLITCQMPEPQDQPTTQRKQKKVLGYVQGYTQLELSHLCAILENLFRKGSSIKHIYNENSKLLLLWK